MRRAAFVAIAACAPLLAACFDLFHATDDILSMCELDASASDACAQATTPEAAVDASDEAEAAAFNPDDFCASDSNTARAAAERACRLLGACSGPLGQNQFGACMVRAILAYDCATNPDEKPSGAALDVWRCMARATDCASAAKCTRKAGCTAGEIATACLDATHRTACNGNPDGGLALVESCAAWGQVCVDGADGGPSCGGPAKTVPCAASSCSGNTLVGCDSASQNDVGVDCTQFGAGRCATTSVGPVCASSGAACPPSTAVSCNNAIATACLSGTIQRVDCTKLTLGQGVCVVGPASPTWDLASSCFRPGAQCPSPPDSCDGNVLKSCVRGVTYTTLCPNGCNANVATPDGPRAACNP